MPELSLCVDVSSSVIDLFRTPPSYCRSPQVVRFIQRVASATGLCVSFPNIPVIPLVAFHCYIRKCYSHFCLTTPVTLMIHHSVSHDSTEGRISPLFVLVCSFVHVLLSHSYNNSGIYITAQKFVKFCLAASLAP